MITVRCVFHCSQIGHFFKGAQHLHLQKKWNVVSLQLLYSKCSKCCWSQGQLKALLLQEESTRWSTKGNNELHSGRALERVFCVAKVKAEITRLLILLLCETLSLDLWITCGSYRLLSLTVQAWYQLKSVVQYNYHTRQMGFIFFSWSLGVIFLFSFTG